MQNSIPEAHVQYFLEIAYPLQYLKVFPNTNVKHVFHTYEIPFFVHCIKHGKMNIFLKYFFPLPNLKPITLTSTGNTCTVLLSRNIGEVPKMH